MSKSFCIQTDLFNAKVYYLGESLITGGYDAEKPILVIKRSHVYTKNPYTNTSEPIDADYLGITYDATAAKIAANYSELKGLFIMSSRPTDHATVFELAPKPTGKFFVMIGKRLFIYVLASVEHSIKTNNTYELNDSLRRLLYEKFTDDAKTRLEQPEVTATAPTQTSQEAAAPVTSTSVTKSQILRTQNTIVTHLPLLESTTVYGIEVWRPTSFVKSKAEFSIWLKPDFTGNIFIVRDGDDAVGKSGYTITPIVDNHTNNCIKIVFRDGVYAIGFTDTECKKYVEPPIYDIQLCLHTNNDAI